MRSRIISFFKNVSYTLSSNLFSSLISVLIVLVVPKFISVERYGYYQLYLFYVGYVGISYLGLCDGFYLRIGGQYYDELDKSLYSTQFRLLCLFEVVLYSAIYFISFAFKTDANRLFVITWVCVSAVGLCMRWFITFLLQATARIKEYAVVTISEKLVFAFVVLPMVLMGYQGFKLLIVTETASKYISLFIGLMYCRDIVFAKTLPVKSVVPEIRENISVGFKYMLAQLCDMLIIGVVRFGVQSYWDIATFSKVSLTLTVSNLAMMAINAISVVMYPTLRRTGEKNLPILYLVMRVTLIGFALGALVFFYPLQRILSAWLPQYAESLRYAAILFPVCVYQSKNSLLVNTYYKTLRLEKLMMRCNMSALALSVVCTFLSTVLLNSVTAAILSILFVLIFRGIVSEMLLARHISIEVRKDILIELFMTIVFIVCNWYFGVVGMFVYAGCYVLYLFMKKSDIQETISFIKSMR